MPVRGGDCDEVELAGSSADRVIRKDSLPAGIGVHLRIETGESFKKTSSMEQDPWSRVQEMWSTMRRAGSDGNLPSAFFFAPWAFFQGGGAACSAYVVCLFVCDCFVQRVSDVGLRDEGPV